MVCLMKSTLLCCLVLEASRSSGSLSSVTAMLVGYVLVIMSLEQDLTGSCIWHCGKTDSKYAIETIITTRNVQYPEFMVAGLEIISTTNLLVNADVSILNMTSEHTKLDVRSTCSHVNINYIWTYCISPPRLLYICS